MDYIYGKLNQKVEKQSYKGKTSDTATTYVDNVNGTISVQIKDSYIKGVDKQLFTLREAINELEKVQKELLNHDEELSENIDIINKSFNSISLDIEELKSTIETMENKYNKKFIDITKQLDSMKPIIDKEGELISFDYEV